MKFVLILLVFFQSFKTMAQDDSLESFLSAHSLLINNKAGTFPYLDCKKYVVTLYGNLHDQPLSSLSFINLLKNYTCDTTVDLILELGPSDEYFLNRFLKFPSRNIPFKKDSIHIMSLSKEKNYFYPIRSIFLNHGLTNRNRFHGIDLERNFSISLFSLGVILDGNTKELNQSLKLHRDTISEYLTQKSNRQLYSICEYFIESFNKDSLAYLKHLKRNDYLYYSRIIHALAAGLEYDKLDQAFGEISKQKGAELRESYMFNNLTTLIQQYPFVHFVGEFGLTHIVSKQELWAGLRNWVSLGGRLNELFLGHICRIVNYYEKKKYFSNQVIIDDKDWPLFKKFAAKKKSTLFDMRDFPNAQYEFIEVNRY